MKDIIQPKYVPKHKSLTTQQITYLTARIQGKSKIDSKRLAKYSENSSAASIESNPNLQAALREVMKANGLTEQFLTEELMQGLKKKKTLYFSKDGIVSDERTIDDNDIQHKYFRDALEIRGDIKSSVIENMNLGIIRIPSKMSEEEWNSRNDNANNTSQEKID